MGERYEILEKIGAGGMSDVYRARDHRLNRDVAVKVLKQEFNADKNFISKFRTEAHAAACLSHPNIVHVFDALAQLPGQNLGYGLHCVRSFPGIARGCGCVRSLSSGAAHLK